MSKFSITFFITIVFGALLSQAMANDSPAVVTVDGKEITREQFEREVYAAARQTFYHGSPKSESEYLEFRRQIADDLVDRALLVAEAKRQGVEPDHGSISAQLAAYEDQYADTARWQEQGEVMLERVRARLEEDSVLSRFEQQVRSVAGPEDTVLREYYAANPAKFTEPDQFRVSVILLAVAPSQPPSAWGAALDEAGDILQRIRNGESIAELARMHSADPSSRNGGDMGYLHAGMLSGAAQQAIDQLEVGEISEPVTVLEGVAIFKLTDRRQARLRSFDDVRQRASDLWRKDEGERAWNETLARLRSVGTISIDEDYLRSLPAESL